jgi:hypothetical protein
MPARLPMPWVNRDREYFMGANGVPRALITGITGQDGSHLAELLLDKRLSSNWPRRIRLPMAPARNAAAEALASAARGPVALSTHHCNF